MRKTAIALILLTLFVAAVSFAGVEPKPREQKVHVQFYSKPDNCDLYVDGKFVGSTDVVLRLGPGDHVVEMKREGYETWRRTLSVTSDNPTRVAGLLKSER
jgi:hypothetical protein